MPWNHVYERTTDVPADAVWAVIADVARWPEVDANIERLAIDGAPAAGTSFRLKPRGGPELRFTISRFEPPSIYADLCRMPGARMETVHRVEGGERTRIRIAIHITGPAAPLWGWLVGRRHAAGLPAQTDRLLARAAGTAHRTSDPVAQAVPQHREHQGGAS